MGRIDAALLCGRLSRTARERKHRKRRDVAATCRGSPPESPFGRSQTVRDQCLVAQEGVRMSVRKGGVLDPPGGVHPLTSEPSLPSEGERVPKAGWGGRGWRKSLLCEVCGEIPIAGRSRSLKREPMGNEPVRRQKECTLSGVGHRCKRLGIQPRGPEWNLRGWRRK